MLLYVKFIQEFEFNFQGGVIYLFFSTKNYNSNIKVHLQLLKSHLFDLIIGDRVVIKLWFTWHLSWIHFMYAYISKLARIGKPTIRRAYSELGLVHQLC